MQTMNISLPEPLKAVVDAQVASGNYSSASEYIRELIRADEKARSRERLEELLLEGLNSGNGEEATPEFWKKLWTEAESRPKKP
jgi:antitoxin ParD1/3/4